MTSLPNATPPFGLGLGALTYSASGTIVPSLQFVEPAMSIMDEETLLKLDLSNAFFWRHLGLLQYLFCLLLGWYLVYCFMKKRSNPIGVSGRRKETTDLVFASSYSYLDLFIRHWLNHVCPDLSNPLTPYMYSPWLARLAGYALLTVSLLVLRLSVFFVFDVLGSPRVKAEARYVKNLILIQVLRLVVIPLARFLKWNSEVVHPFLFNNLVPITLLAVLLKLIYLRPIAALVGFVVGQVAFLLIYALVWLYRRLTFVERKCLVCLEMIEYGEAAEQLTCHGHEMHHHCLAGWLEHGNGCPLCRRAVNLDE